MSSGRAAAWSIVVPLLKCTSCWGIGRWCSVESSVIWNYGDSAPGKLKCEKRSLDSGLFILLRQNIGLAVEGLEALVQGVQMALDSMVLGDMRVHFEHWQ